MNPRETCYQCLRPRIECYCGKVEAFSTDPQFVFLTHPKEYRKGINTGKMARRFLSNSHLFVGVDFTNHQILNSLLSERDAYILFPGENSIPLEGKSSMDFKNSILIILDGTWSTAKSIFKASENLHKLPYLSFRDSKSSNYKIRKQPGDGCLSTVETVAHVLEILESGEPKNRQSLLEVFHEMVERQIKYEEG